jgi:hypothetical protein
MPTISVNLKDFTLLREAIRYNIYELKNNYNYDVIEAFNGERAAKRYLKKIEYCEKALSIFNIIEQYVNVETGYSLILENEELIFLLNAIDKQLKFSQKKIYSTCGDYKQWLEEQIEDLIQLYKKLRNYEEEVPL